MFALVLTGILWAITSMGVSAAAIADNGAERVPSVPGTRSASGPSYRMIPLEPGNHSKSFEAGMSIDSAGDVLVIGGDEADAIEIIDRKSGMRRKRLLAPLSTQSKHLTGDGTRYFYHGGFPQVGFGIGYLDLASDLLTLVVRNMNSRDPGSFLDADREGNRIAFHMLIRPGGNANPYYEYAFHDVKSGELRQLTDDPNAIVYDNTFARCPQTSGTEPMISADGQRIVLISGSTLGIAPPDETAWCRVFSYEVATQEWRFVRALPAPHIIHFASLSDDATWLSFATIRHLSPTPPRIPSPSLLNVETGELIDPIPGTAGFVSFDSVVTGDGQHVILSSQGDLDPTVGNTDHNLELFSYDMETGEVSQVSQTVGGIGRTPSGCDAYEPETNANGEVVLFSFLAFSGGGCELDGQQRSESDGFAFQRVRAVKIRPSNAGPSLSPVRNVYAQAGTQLNLHFAADDPDGDPITFFFQLADTRDVPEGAVVEDFHDGSASLHWPTQAAQAGVYPMRMAAFDEGGGEDFETFRISLCANAAPESPTLNVVETIFGSPKDACYAADFNGDLRTTAADLLL